MQSPLSESTRRGVVQLREATFLLLREHWARDKRGRFASHSHPGNEAGWGPAVGGAGTKATTAEIAGARKAALAKAKAAPPPSAADQKRWLDKRAAGIPAEEIERNDRGSAGQRRERKGKLQGEFGNGKDFAIDPYCGQKLGFEQIEQDRIYPGSKGGRYRYNNIVPCCSGCNKARGDTDFMVFFKRTGK